MMKFYEATTKHSKIMFIYCLSGLWNAALKNQHRRLKCFSCTPKESKQKWDNFDRKIASITCGFRISSFLNMCQVF